MTDFVAWLFGLWGMGVPVAWLLLIAWYALAAPEDERMGPQWFYVGSLLWPLFVFAGMACNVWRVVWWPFRRATEHAIEFRNRRIEGDARVDATFPHPRRGPSLPDEQSWTKPPRNTG